MSAGVEARRTLVTGGSMGIGRQVARKLAELGGRVVIAGRSHHALVAAVAELPGSGHQAIRLDVSDAASWPEAIARIDRGGALSGVVTAAGVLGPIGSLDAVAADEFAAAIAVSLIGTALSLHHALPRLVLTK
jgi:NAD(P)-dependent dehydrogenase (short-subunit alcohol dehydrogenase family)